MSVVPTHEVPLTDFRVDNAKGDFENERTPLPKPRRSTR